MVRQLLISFFSCINVILVCMPTVSLVPQKTGENRQVVRNVAWFFVWAPTMARSRPGASRVDALPYGSADT